MQQVDSLWGHFIVLSEGRGYKVKELHFTKDGSTSRQHHTDRTEILFCTYGEFEIEIGLPPEHTTIYLKADSHIEIARGSVHKIKSMKERGMIVEIQYGKRCDEWDIIRYNDGEEDWDKN